MKRVTGIGGIFFKSENPQQLYEWYVKHLGIQLESHGQAATFHWLDPRKRNKGMTVWSIFPHDTKYFSPGRASFMINYRVENLDALLAALKQERVEVDPKREDYEYGRFAWILDPEGNRIELWEPPKTRVKAKAVRGRKKQPPSSTGKRSRKTARANRRSARRAK